MSCGQRKATDRRTYAEEFAKVMKHLRKETPVEGQRVTPDDLASRTGVHRSTVYRYEKGLTTPDVAYLERFEDALGLPRGAVLRCVIDELHPGRVAGDEYEVLQELSSGEDSRTPPLELLQSRYAQEAHGLKKAMGFKGADRVVDHLYAFGRTHPGSAEIAARWVGTVLRAGFERPDDRILRRDFSEHFYRPEELSDQDVYVIASALLTALSVMARRFQSTVEDWPKESGEEPDVTS